MAEDHIVTSECVCGKASERRINALWPFLERYSSLRGELLKKSFAGFDHPASTLLPLGKAFDAAKQFANEPKGWLFLHGSPGIGKTHLTAAIANSLIAHRRPVLFLNVPELLGFLRAGFHVKARSSADPDFETRLQTIRDFPVLILDDWGAHSDTPWADEQLYLIFNYRLERALPIVVTSNLPLEEMEPRVRARLLNPKISKAIEVIGSDELVERYSSLRGELLKKTFENFKPKASYPDLHYAFDDARRFANEPKGWLFFIGPPGVGKTHLATAIANTLIKRHKKVLFLNVVELLGFLRAGFNDHENRERDFEERLQIIRDYPVLILDDWGAHSDTPWADEQLYFILNYRTELELPTVVTSNLPVEEMEPRVRSRLTNLLNDHKVIQILAPDYRNT